jgi:anthranilate phosphoribosyltransferase
VNADDGLDEISIAAPTNVAELKDGIVTTYTVTPEQFGLKRASLSELAIADAGSSLAMMKAVLDNRPGPARDIVVLNAGAAIYAADIADSLETGIARADALLASGAARAKLDALITYSNSVKTPLTL